MNSRKLRCVSVKTDPEAEEAIGEILFRLFDATATVWHDLESGESTVSVYVELTRSAAIAGRRALRDKLNRFSGYGLKTGSLKVSARQVKPEDWSESWKRHFRPIEIGNKLLVKPSWSKRKPRSGAAVVILDPGLSFGTGQHPTTCYCLEQLSVAHTPGRQQSFLDLGTGTGVLAIAAAKLGFDPVYGIDFDPSAIRNAQENSRLNGCPSVTYSHQDLLRLPVRSKEQHDVICANLISDVLITGRDRILNRLSKSGRLIIAGILTTQFSQVIECYRNAGMQLIHRKTGGEWTSATLRFDEIAAPC